MLVDRVLEDLDVEVELFALCEIATGSDLPIGDLGWVTMHFVMAGEGDCTIGSDPSIHMPTYSLCLVKRAHNLHGTACSDAGPTPLELEGATRLFGQPSGTSDFVVACGRIQATYGGGLDLFDLLEDPLVVDFSGTKQMRDLFRAILDESAHPTVGSVGMISAMMRQCLVLLLRQLAESSTEGLTWVDALADDRMRAVIEQVLDRPADMHSVESLATTAHMSRAAFAARFRACFGQTPMQFVRRVRLRRSAELLRTTNSSTSAIADRCGFGNRSHFARAFKAEYGVPPGQFRSEHP